MGDFFPPEYFLLLSKYSTADMEFFENKKEIFKNGKKRKNTPLQINYLLCDTGQILNFLSSPFLIHETGVIMFSFP